MPYIFLYYLKFRELIIIIIFPVHFHSNFVFTWCYQCFLYYSSLYFPRLFILFHIICTMCRSLFQLFYLHVCRPVCSLFVNAIAFQFTRLSFLDISICAVWLVVLGNLSIKKLELKCSDARTPLTIFAGCKMKFFFVYFLDPLACTDTEFRFKLLVSKHFVALLSQRTCLF